MAERDSDEVRKYVSKYMERIRAGGYHSHSAFVKNTVSGLGFSDLAQVDPPVVALSNDDDPYYTQYFRSRDEIEKFIGHLREVADEAWPPVHYTDLCNPS